MVRLDWPGRADAERAATGPASGRLCPATVPEGDLVVEGDNLDALKLLMPVLGGRVDAVYADPPYRTGNRFVYRDDLAADAWADLMLPRLILARELLAPSGVVLVSIGRTQAGVLAVLLDEVFGPHNAVTTWVWVNNLKGRQIAGRGAAGTHELVLCHARDAASRGPFRASAAGLKKLMPTAYRAPEHEVKLDAAGTFVTKNHLHNTNSRFNERTRPTLVYDIWYRPSDAAVSTSPLAGSSPGPDWIRIPPHPNRDGRHEYHAWRWSRRRVEAEAHDLEFTPGPSGWRVRTKVRSHDSTAVKDLITDIGSERGGADLAAVLGARVFEHPKPVALMRFLLATVLPPAGWCVDLFAGSGTTGEAVLDLNAQDGGERRYVLLQTPEPCPPSSIAARAGYATIADIALDRTRRVAASLGAAPPALLRVRE